MITREELLKSPDYWFEAAQNDLFAEVKQYLDKENISQTELAEKLNVSKGYISQIMNGNANFTMKKLIAFFISIGRVPQVEYLDFEEVIKKDKIKKERLNSDLKGGIIISNRFKNSFSNPLDIKKDAEKRLKKLPFEINSEMDESAA